MQQHLACTEIAKYKTIAKYVHENTNLGAEIVSNLYACVQYYNMNLESYMLNVTHDQCDELRQRTIKVLPTGDRIEGDEPKQRADFAQLVLARYSLQADCRQPCPVICAK